MITKQHIDEMEDRVTRMFPWIDVTAVNVLRYEIQNLRKLLDKPCALCVEAIEAKKAEKIEKQEEPKKAKREQISKKDSVEGQPEA